MFAVLEALVPVTGHQPLHYPNICLFPPDIVRFLLSLALPV
jgi:hypothetical protein